MRNRRLSHFALAVLAVAGIVPVSAARAGVEGPHIAFSPHAGEAFWMDDSDLAQDILFGGRMSLMLGSALGVEGTVDLTPTTLESSPSVFNRVTHLGAGLMLNMAPHSLINPYLTGGWSRVHYDPANATEGSVNGWEAGGGFKIRLTDGQGKRVDLRLDARNLFLDADPSSSQTSSTQNTLLASAGLQFSMGGSPKDTDWDGIVDRDDDCPDTPRMAVVGAKGCPVDTDTDGIFDGLDQCPSTPASALVNALGCPLDADFDGVYDGLDRCPGTLKGAVIDAAGCPLDTDKDGVPDGIDQCPTTVANVKVDTRTGCAVDSDGDGVMDGVDVCAGTPAGVKVDAQGCPIPTSAREVELLDTGMIRLSTVQFESGRAILKPSSYSALEEVGNILARWPQLRIEIGGHTDSQGAEDFNLRLSEQRAEVVYEYLAAHFSKVALNQFSVRGYGESRSIATNDTPDGRAGNRRVEFRVLNREVLRR